MSLEMIGDLVRQVSRGAKDIPITAETRFVDDLNMSSIELLSFIILCETAFDVRLVGRGELFARTVTAGAALHFIDGLRRDRISAAVS